ncbi:MAG: cation transporter [bacterium]|nr:cation transporter [bacterium]
MWIMLAVFAMELLGGYFSHSLSLLSDSWHVLLDGLAVLVAIWIDWKVSNNHAAEDRWRTRGVRAQGFLLLIIAGWIAIEAWRRMSGQESIASTMMIVVASIGMIANYFQHRILTKGKENSTRTSLDVHILFDLGQSAAVVVGGILIAISGILAIDLIVSGILATIMIISGLLMFFIPKLFGHNHKHHH